MLNNVSLQIRNSENGQLVPCWINLRDSGGNDHAPSGWQVDFTIQPGTDVGGRGVALGRRWFAISGSCEVPGGLGDCELRISHAPGYNCLTTPIRLFPGRLACRVSITSQKTPGENWIAADFRAHSFGVGGLLLESQASGLQLVPLVAGNRLSQNSPHLELKALAEMAGFGGACDRSGILICSGNLNQQKRCGSLVLLDSHRPVFPLEINASNRGDWSLMDWTGQGHRIRGVTVWADVERDEFHCGEAVCAAIQGEIDLFELIDLDPNREGGLKLWHDLAAAGYPIPLVGSTAKDSNATCLGSTRTWIDVGVTNWIGLPLAEKQTCWVTAVKAGHTQVSRWPLITIPSFKLDGENLVLDFEVKGLGEGGTLELVSASGDALAVVGLRAESNSGVISLNIAEKNLTMFAPRVRDGKGDIVVQGSWLKVPVKNPSYPGCEEAIGRISGRIHQAIHELDSWEDSANGGGEIRYRRELYARTLETLKRRQAG